MRTKTVLVRGATGFLGEALAKMLLADCAEVRLFCRRQDRLDPLLAGAGIEVVTGDAHDPDVVARSLRGVDIVIDCIGETVPAVAPDALLPEVERSLAPLAVLLDAMLESPGRELLFLSSGGAIYGSEGQGDWVEEDATAPESAYGAGKLLEEEMVRFRARRGEATGLIARTSNVYGRRRLADLPQGVIDIFIDRALRGEPVEYWGDGSQVRDFLFVDDFVSAIRALLDLPPRNQTVNVASGVGSSIDEVLAAIEKSVGATAGVRTIGRFDPGVPRNVLGIGKLQALTGWSPRFALASGIAEAVRRRSRGNEPAADHDRES